MDLHLRDDAEEGVLGEIQRVASVKKSGAKTRRVTSPFSPPATIGVKARSVVATSARA